VDRNRGRAKVRDLLRPFTRCRRSPAVLIRSTADSRAARRLTVLSLCPALLILAVSSAAPVGAPLPRDGEALRSLQDAASRRYAELAHRLYDRCVHEARELRAAITVLVAAPSPETLAAARRSWPRRRRSASARCWRA
jgi:uncharacterized iron-regulated protein